MLMLSAGVVQLVERLLAKEKVRGSSPLARSTPGGIVTERRNWDVQVPQPLGLFLCCWMAVRPLGPSFQAGQSPLTPPKKIEFAAQEGQCAVAIYHLAVASHLQRSLRLHQMHLDDLARLAFEPPRRFLRPFDRQALEQAHV